MIKYPLLIMFLCFLLSACKTEYKKLENYYRVNEKKHHELSDYLIAFCKTNHTKIILRKSNYPETAISFQILFEPENTFYPIYFDSSLNRHDLRPDKTSKFHIPSRTIKNFYNISYSVISSTSNQTFFGGSWHAKVQLGTQGDSQYGVLISTDTTISKSCKKRLSPNVCLTEGTIP